MKEGTACVLLTLLLLAATTATEARPDKTKVKDVAAEVPIKEAAKQNDQVDVSELKKEHRKGRTNCRSIHNFIQ